VRRLYGHSLHALEVEHPWCLYEYEALGVVVAGLNSTMMESHRDEDHYGWLGEAQLNWFKSRLARYQREQWLRIGLVHHNLVRGAVNDDENLRDADDFQRILGGSLDFVFHGHTHNGGKPQWLSQKLPILSTGSAAVEAAARPVEVPNQYQIVRITSDYFEQYGRCYAVSLKKWIGDTRITDDGNDWRQRTSYPSVPLPPARTGAAAEEPASPQSWSATEDDLLSRVAEIVRLRYPSSQVARVQSPFSDGTPYLRVSAQEDIVVDQWPVGGAEEPTIGMLDAFVRDVHQRYASTNPTVRSQFVYTGSEISREIVDDYARRGVEVKSLLQFQSLMDFRRYLEWQRRELTSSPTYQSDLYVPHRYEVADSPLAGEDLLSDLVHWLNQPEPLFGVVLGDFGLGKTFLLRQLALRLPVVQPSVVPIFIQMRQLQKARSLDELVAQHFAAAGLDSIPLAALRYLLRHGRIALLFDGFDELALRTTYEGAADHLSSLIAASEGNAKIIVSSRTQYFLTDEQVQTALTDRVASTAAGMVLIQLKGFNETQIRTYLSNRFGSPAEAAEWYQLIDDIRDLLGLSQNPRMLGFICALGQDRLARIGDELGRIKAADLYRELIEAWLRFEETRATGPGALSTLRGDDRFEALVALATRLWETGASDIAIADLDKAAAALLSHLSDTDLTVAEASHTLGSGSLLTRSADGRFAFAHQSVLEWLIAYKAGSQLAGDDADPLVLSKGRVSTLMADFFVGLTGPETARDWARSTVNNAEAAPVARANATIVLARGEWEDSTRRDLRLADLSGVDLRGLNLSGLDLASANFDEAHLSEANLERSNLHQASLRGARLVNARLNDAVLSDCDVTGATFARAQLARCDLSGIQAEGAHWVRANLSGATASAEVLRDAHLQGAATGTGRMSLGIGPSRALFGNAITYLRDLDVLALARGAGIWLFDGSTGEPIKRIACDSTVTDLCAPQAGRLIAAIGRDGTALLVDVVEEAAIDRLKPPQVQFQMVRFSTDGRSVILVANGGRIARWIFTVAQVDFASSPRGTVLDLATPNGSVVALAQGAAGHELWRFGGGLELQSTTKVADEQVQEPATWAMCSDGDVIVVADQRGLISLSGDRVISRSSMSYDRHTKLAVASDGAWCAVATSDGRLSIVDTRSGECISQSVVEKAVTSMAPMQDAQLLVTSHQDGSVRAWHARTLQPVWTLPTNSGYEISTMHHDAETDLLQVHRTSGVDATWDLGSLRLTPHTPPRPAEAATIPRHGAASLAHLGTTTARDQTRDGRYRVEGMETGRIVLVDINTGSVVKAFGDGHTSIDAVQFAASDEYIASATETRLVFWHTPLPDSLGRIAVGAVHSAAVLHIGSRTRCLAVNVADDQLLAGSDDGVVRILKRNGQGSDGFSLHHAFGAHDGPVQCIVIIRPSGLLATGGWDGVVRLWDPAKSHECVGELFSTAEGGIALSGRVAEISGNVPPGTWLTESLVRVEVPSPPKPPGAIAQSRTRRRVKSRTSGPS